MDRRRFFAPFALAAFTTSLAASALLAQPPAKQDDAPPAPEAVFVIEKLEIDKILTAAKDQGLRKALHMLPARLGELRDELPQGEAFPIEIVALVDEMTRSTVRVGITYSPANQAGGFFGAGVVLSLPRADEAAANKTSELVNGIMKSGHTPKAKPSKKFETMQDIVTPLGTVRFGPRKTASGWAYEIHVGSVIDPDASLKDLTALNVAGVDSFLRAHFDPAPLTPLLGFLQMMAGGNPGAASAVQQMTDAGVIGPDAIKYDFVLGHQNDRTVAVTRMRGAGKHPAASFSKILLTDADMKVIPADAHMGFMGTMDLTSTRKSMEDLANTQPEMQEAMNQIKAKTGVDPIKDLLAAVGSRFALYTSDATGGGSLASMVVLIGVQDKAKLMATMSKLQAKANEALSNEDTKGHVSIQNYTDPADPATTCFALRFPGVPVPLEPTFALAGDWLVVGASPQAALGAARQINGKGDAGIMSNANVASMFPKGKGFVNVGFNDPAKTMRGGYPFVSMFGTAISNAMSSRMGFKGEARNPGLIVPTYSDLLAGAKAQISYSFWDADDYVSQWEGDASLLVNIGTTVGAASTFWPLVVAAGAGAAIPAMEHAQEAARHHQGDMKGDEDEDDEDAKADEPQGKKKAPNFMLIPRERH